MKLFFPKLSFQLAITKTCWCKGYFKSCSDFPKIPLKFLLEKIILGFTLLLRDKSIHMSYTLISMAVGPV